MQFKTFKINASSPELGEGDVNAFLRSHRILSVERYFSQDKGGYWALLVEYAEDGHADYARPVKRRERVPVTDELNDVEKIKTAFLPSFLMLVLHNLM